MIRGLISVILGIIDILLVLRIIFLLFGAGAVGFAALLYSWTNPLVAPFQGIFPAPQAGGAYFDVAALLAIIVYSIIGWVIGALLDVISRPSFR